MTKISFTKFPNLKIPKASSAKIIQPKVPTGKSTISSLGNSAKFNFSKFTKAPKLPKATKLSIVKKAVKKAKNVGY